jgi:hypothetical protein
MKQWRVAIGGRQYGPISEEELKCWIAEGRVGAGDLVWSEGMPAWAAAGTQPELGFPPAGAHGALPFAPPAAYQQPHRAGAILALGILGIVPCFICGIIAWVMGNGDLRKMDEGIMDPAGRGMTQAGKVCGIVGTIIGISYFVLYFIWLIIFFTVVMPKTSYPM